MGAVGGAWPGSVRASGPRRQATLGRVPGQVATGSVPCHHVIRLDAATVLLQWAAGGLFFLWFTTRRREVGLGYGWLLRGVYGAMAAGAAWCGFGFGVVPVRAASSIAVVLATLVALAVSIIRKGAGVRGAEAEHDRRTERVAAMTGIDRVVTAERTDQDVGPEFPPILDLVAALVAVPGLLAAALDAGGHWPVAVLRTFAGALFLGAVTDAMLLPVGMFAVFSGEVDDGWNGTLGWFWAACAVTTIGLVLVTRAALKERYYSAVMAATGLLYLAILTAFGTDLVARAVLAG